ncbi:MAG: hypothetical protein JSS79_18235 [Bacteroidetes bacterium]|nr:hypothetical protein [Bacteroidota bacterium]
MSYYLVLSISYLTAIPLGWMAMMKMYPSIASESATRAAPSYKRLFVMIACIVAVIAIGQLYVYGFLMPEITAGSIRIGESINQVLIYSPFLIYALLEYCRGSEIWVPKQHWKQSLMMGTLLSFVAMIVFWFLTRHHSFLTIVHNAYHVKNTHHAVQIFLEDLSIALLVSQLTLAVMPRHVISGTLLVALAFAFAHLPGNLHAAPLMTLIIERLCDAALVFGVVQALRQTRDFLWLFPIHFAMDMMQFYGGS